MDAVEQLSSAPILPHWPEMSRSQDFTKLEASILLPNQPPSGHCIQFLNILLNFYQFHLARGHVRSHFTYSPRAEFFFCSPGRSSPPGEATPKRKPKKMEYRKVVFLVFSLHKTFSSSRNPLKTDYFWVGLRSTAYEQKEALQEARCTLFYNWSDS